MSITIAPRSVRSSTSHARSWRRLPAGPLLAEVDRRGENIGWLFTPSEARSYYRAVVTDTLTLLTADRLAVALGMHPIELWGSDWTTGGAR